MVLTLLTYRWDPTRANPTPGDIEAVPWEQTTAHRNIDDLIHSLGESIGYLFELRFPGARSSETGIAALLKQAGIDPNDFQYVIVGQGDVSLDNYIRFEEERVSSIMYGVRGAPHWMRPGTAAKEYSYPTDKIQGVLIRGKDGALFCMNLGAVCPQEVCRQENVDSASRINYTPETAELRYHLMDLWDQLRGKKRMPRVARIENTGITQIKDGDFVHIGPLVLQVITLDNPEQYVRTALLERPDRMRRILAAEQAPHEYMLGSEVIRNIENLASGTVLLEEPYGDGPVSTITAFRIFPDRWGTMDITYLTTLHFGTGSSGGAFDIYAELAGIDRSSLQRHQDDAQFNPPDGPLFYCAQAKPDSQHFMPFRRYAVLESSSALAETVTKHAHDTNRGVNYILMTFGSQKYLVTRENFGLIVKPKGD